MSSDSDARRRKRQKGRSTKEARHVRLYHYLLTSPAWQSLSPVSRALYLEMAQLYNGSNNGRIGYSVRRAATALGSGKSTVSRAFSELEERGFISVSSAGSFDFKTRHATEWRLTDLTCDLTGKEPSREFMRWGREKQKPVPVAGLSVPVAGHPSQQRPSNHPQTRAFGT